MYFAVPALKYYLFYYTIVKGKKGILPTTEAIFLDRQARSSYHHW
jgi:hypothetical protein